MTHFVFGIRGIWASVQQMITDLNAQRFWWRRKNLTELTPDGKPNPNFNKVEDIRVQGILRPMWLFEYVYPSESPEQPGNLDSPMIDNTQVMLKAFDLKGADHYIPSSIGKYVRFAGKMAGLKKIPDFKNEGLHHSLWNERSIHLLGTSIIPIGLKDDEFKIHDFGMAGKYEQEGI